MLCRFTNQESFNMTPTDIQPGDVVLATWQNIFDFRGKLKTVYYPVLHSHVGRVRDICDHRSDCMGKTVHMGTSILFEDGEQLPIQYCRILFRPFKSEILEESKV